MHTSDQHIQNEFNEIPFPGAPAVWAAEVQTWCSQVVRRYRVRMWHSVESAVSSTDAAGMLHTAMPVGPGGRSGLVTAACSRSGEETRWLDFKSIG